jgi:cytochrome c biogenesis protein
VKTAKIHRSNVSPNALIRLFACNQVTLFLLVVLTLSIIAYYQTTLEGRIWLITVPSFLLIINFLLALATRRILKSNWPLMVFHFALITLVLLVFAGRMSYFRGTVELAENEEFFGQLENIQQGPWHRYGLAQVRFSNLGFRIHYHQGIKRANTINQIGLTTGEGQQQLLEIGDHVPLIIGHYRFYTSHNKGYAPVFEWRPSGSAEVQVGSIHLPAYPTHEYRQALEWQIPDSDHTLWTMLRIEEDVLPPDRDFDFRVPQQHKLIVRYQDQRHELTPGDELSLPQGLLLYRELSTWMGYRVDYDWTRPWLLATVLIGLGALFWHYIEKFSLIRATSKEDC